MNMDTIFFFLLETLMVRKNIHHFFITLRRDEGL